MPQHPPLWQEIRDRWLLGHSTAQIARSLHTSEAEVYNLLPHACDRPAERTERTSREPCTP